MSRHYQNNKYAYKKRYLSRAWHIQKEVHTLKETVARIYDQASSIGGISYGGVYSKSVHNEATFARKIASAIDLEHKIASKVESQLAVINEIYDAIMRIDDVILRTLLEKRYMQFKRWENIAAEMSYSEKHIFKLHDKALEVFEVPEND